MVLGIDPKVDYAFKHLLARPVTLLILIDLLNKVLNLATGHRIRQIELLNPFNPKETFNDKISIVDIKARDENGRLYNIEMQMVAPRSYKQRIVYYATRLHQQQLQEGQGYDLLRPTVSITFLNDVMFPDDSNYHSRIRLMEESRHFVFSDAIEFHILELPKFTKTALELNNDLDIWLYFLRHAEKMDTDNIPPAMKLNPQAIQALEVLKMLSQNELERERYESRRKAQMDHDSWLRDARNDGIEEGVQKGRMEGRMEGEKIGIIHICERLLGRPETPGEQLALMSPEELACLAEELQKQTLQQR
jgi:predicted transposase/invertase (TIGR01784 family)